MVKETEEERNERIERRREKFLLDHPDAVFCVECGAIISDFSFAERHCNCCSHCYDKNHGIIYIPLDDSGRFWKKIDRDKGTEEIIEETVPTEETELEVSVLELRNNDRLE